MQKLIGLLADNNLILSGYKCFDTYYGILRNPELNTSTCFKLKDMSAEEFIEQYVKEAIDNICLVKAIK